jgi:hypothetical protein
MSAALTRWVEEWSRTRTKPPRAIAVRGAGELLTQLQARWPEAIALALAPDEQPRLEARFAIDTRVEIWGGRLRRALVAGWEVQRASPPESSWSVAPSTAQFDRAIDRARREAELDHGTVTRLGRTMITNVVENLGWLADAPPAQALGAAWCGLPAVVLGAGPSLDRVLEPLRAHRDRVLLVAATSALPALHRAGLVPDAAVMIESRRCDGHFESLPAHYRSAIALIAASQVAPPHLELGWKCVLSFHGASGRWLRRWNSRSTVVPTCGNVGTTMIFLAWMLGGFPVMTAGIDFACSGARYYAQDVGRPSEPRIELPRQLQPGWTGNLVEATPELIHYRDSTELILAEIAKRDPRARFLSVTGSGARVRGMSFVPIAQVLAALDPIAPNRRGAWLAKAAAWPQRAPEPHLLEAVDRDLQRIDRELAALRADPRGTDVALMLSPGHDPFLELALTTGTFPLIAQAWRDYRQAQAAKQLEQLSQSASR